MCGGFVRPEKFGLCTRPTFQMLNPAARRLHEATHILDSIRTGEGSLAPHSGLYSCTVYIPVLL